MRLSPEAYFLGFTSLRSKRFQSSYYAKVRAEAKKKGFPLPLPRHSIFFCSGPGFLDEPREETLATQVTVLRDEWGKPWRFFFDKVTSFFDNTLQALARHGNHFSSWLKT